MGLFKWFAQQLNPPSVDDSAFVNYTTPDPVDNGNLHHNDGSLGCAYESQLLEHQVSSNRQVLEKLVQHWLEHFSVNDATTIPAPAGQYVNTVRRDALGNFATLVSDVAREPEMLSWLSNGGYIGSNPSVMPNQNFGREVMQLYTMGINRLNMDGTPIVDANNNPLPNYTQNDIEVVSRAMTGYGSNDFNFGHTSGPVDVPAVNVTTFDERRHGKGPYTFLGQTIPDPGDATVMDRVIKVMTQNPSVAPFESKELIERLVTETPSRGYVERVATVWAATQDDPRQIAKVVSAIVNDREYAGAVVQPMLRESGEFAVDAIRALGGQYANPLTSTQTSPMSGLRSLLSWRGAHLMQAPTVFGFYDVGDKESVLDNGEMINRYVFAARVANVMKFTTLPSGTRSGCNTDYGFNIDARKMMKLPPAEIADYLLDALVDGGSPSLRALVRNYVSGDATRIPGAVYIIMTSPEYEVN